MPVLYGTSAPKCPKCGKAVYIAEQAIGPQSKAYHKSCLTCVVCNKRLDSSLSVEHDGQPLCSHCHRETLGIGKGGFNKAVPLRASLPPSPSKSIQHPPTSHRKSNGEDDLTASFASTSLTSRQEHIQSSRKTPPSPSASSNVSATPPTSSLPLRPSNPTPSTALAPLQPDKSVPIDTVFPSSIPPSAAGYQAATEKDWRGAESIDDYIAFSAGVPNIIARSAVMRGSADASSEDRQTRFNGGNPVDRQQIATSTQGSPQRGASRPLPQTPTSASTSVPSAYAATTKVATAPALSDSVSSGGLPPPTRRTPVSSSTPSFKTAPTPSSTSSIHSSPFRSQYTGLSSSNSSTPTRLANAVSSGTPLCARCSRPVYHAEQVIAASGARTWHRPCLRCEECGSTLQKGSLEEGPVGGSVHDGVKSGESYGQGCNTFCKVCYRRLFGPRGIGYAGSSEVRS